MENTLSGGLLEGSHTSNVMKHQNLGKQSFFKNISNIKNKKNEKKHPVSVYFVY